MKLIEIWFGLAIPSLVGAVALGPGMTMGAGALLFALSCVPAGLVLLLWPATQPPTAADVLRERKRPA